MTTTEFSNLFDILYNNITSNQAPGLDEYEKSVFLTKAQDEIVKAYFNPKGNKFLEGYDFSQNRQVDFSTLTETKVFSKYNGTKVTLVETSYSDVYEFPKDIVAVINETLAVTNSHGRTAYLLVVPINHDEYMRVMNRPFRLPLRGLAWRLITNSKTTDGTPLVELYAHLGETPSKYTIRYVRKPKPIILTDIENEEGLTIHGEGSTLTSELPKELHEDILLRAVELAKAAYIGNIDPSSNLGAIVTLGLSSATNIGIVSK